MNILFVIESLNMGGAEKSLVTLLQHLPEDKYKIELLLFKKGGQLESEIPDYITIINQPIHLNIAERIIYQLKRRIQRPKHDAQLFRSFALRNLKPIKAHYDIAVAYNQGLSTYFVANNVTAKKKIAWINVDYQKAGYEIAKDLSFYKKFNDIVTVSQPAYDSFITALHTINVTDIKPIIIKDISDSKDIIKKSEAFNPEFNNEKVNIVTVGRLAKPKGYPLALETAKILKEKNIVFHWHIIGEGPERKNLESLIQKHSLQNYVTLHGNQSNPYPYVKYADIYVQPSLFEGLGLSVIEATILKKPIICTNFPTAHQIINDGETGLICEMNSKSLYKALIDLIDNTEFRNRLISQLNSRSELDKISSLAKFRKLLIS